MSKNVFYVESVAYFLFIKSSFLNRYNIILKTTIEFIDLMHN